MLSITTIFLYPNIIFTYICKKLRYIHETFSGAHKIVQDTHPKNNGVGFRKKVHVKFSVDFYLFFV